MRKSRLTTELPTNTTRCWWRSLLTSCRLPKWTNPHLVRVLRVRVRVRVRG